MLGVPDRTGKAEYALAPRLVLSHHHPQSDFTAAVVSFGDRTNLGDEFDFRRGIQRKVSPSVRPLELVQRGMDGARMNGRGSLLRWDGGGGQVLPPLPGFDILNYLARQRALIAVGLASALIARASASAILGEPGSSALWMLPSSDRVVDVVLLRSEHEVIWVHAPAAIVCVPKHLPGRDLMLVQAIRDDVGSLRRSTPNTELGVPAPLKITRPHPKPAFWFGEVPRFKALANGA